MGIKNEVKHLKAEIKNVEHLEDELETIGRDQINNLSKTFEKEVRDLKIGIEDIRKEITTSKERNIMQENPSDYKEAKVGCHNIYISKECIGKIKKLLEEGIDEHNTGAVLLAHDQANNITEDTLAILVLKPNDPDAHKTSRDITLEEHNIHENIGQLRQGQLGQHVGQPGQHE